MSSIKQRIEEIKKEIQQLESDLRLKRYALQELQSVSSRKSKKSSKKGRAPRKGSLVEYLVKVLQDSEKPMQLVNIVEKIKSSGYSSNASVGLNNLIPSAMSKRTDLFFRNGHGVYGLVGKHEQTTKG